jgi:hypothetical protein
VSRCQLLGLLLALAGCGKTTSATGGEDTGVSRGATTGEGDSAPLGGESDPGGVDSPADSAPPTDTAPEDTSPTPPLVLEYPEQRVGIFYLAWHTFAAQAMQSLAAEEQLTVEDVIRDTSLYFSDVVWDRGLYNAAAAFHYHLEPEPGFYCLFRQVEGDALSADYDLPDCPDISDTAALHARQLWDAGVDFVYLDLTNLPTYSEFGLVLGLRPLEVLLEEWDALRAAGEPTPQIAGWVPGVVAEDPMYAHVLDVYERFWGSDVLFRPDGGDPALFIVNAGEADALDAVRARGVTPVPLWGNLSQSTLDSGVAGWMQPCTSSGAFTTLIDPATPCAQGYTTTSPLGTVLSVSHSFQIGYASLPFQAAGRHGGLTLQKQFETAFAVQPDVLIINAWNEFIAQPQANPYDASYGGLRRSMGVTDVAADEVSADWLWVDMYGVEFDRDIEPTVEAGDGAYQLMASCLRVWRTGATSCDDAGEACCQLGEGMAPIWSLRVAGGTGEDTDHLITNNPAERDPLLAGGWEEICNPHYGPPGFCGGGAEGSGPFLLYRSAGADRAPLYRCYSGVDHFFSLDAACEGTTAEYTLGYLSTVRTSETPRPLRRCYNAGDQVHFHWLDEHCPSGHNEEAILGYVR